MKFPSHIIFPIVLLFSLILGALPAFAQAEKKADATLSEPRIIRGTDIILAPPKPPGIFAGGAAGLKFEDAPLADVVHVVMREIVKVSYVLHPPINGSVTLATQGTVTGDHAILLLEYALQANGYLIAQDTRGTYHIGKPEIIKAIVPAVRQVVKNSPLQPGYGAIVIPLTHIGATEMAMILRPLAPPDAILRIDTLRNMLVMVGNRTQSEGWLDLVATFDVDLLKGMSVGVFPLKHISAKDIDSALRALTTVSSGAPAAGVPAVAQRAPAANTAATAATPINTSLFSTLRIFPMESLNSVLVVTPRAAYLDEARQWIEKLDKPGLNASESQLFVYPVQNGSAVHLAGVLNGLFGTTTTGSAPIANSGVAPSLGQSSASTAPSGLSSGGSPTALSSNAGRSNIQGSGITSIALNAGLRVVADEVNNAVLVYSNAGEYTKVEATLKRLDVPPTQVMIEASIIEVTLTDDLKYGLQWIFSDRASSGFSGTGVLSTAAGAALAAAPAGFSYTLRNTLGDVRAVLNALAEKSLVKVISSPSLMVLNNHTASIVVGNQQPIRVGETITTGGNITTNIQYKDTGISLSVTPSVNSGNMVTMQLNQSVNDVGQVDVATGQRSFLQRQIGSKVAVRSGETLVLGGLIKDNSTSGKSGLPWLQDIPLFGNLFGANTTNNNRTELLVVITPVVVRSDNDLRELTATMRSKMRDIYPAVGAGGRVDTERLVEPSGPNLPSNAPTN
jgi:general secretion pathway protein D